MSFSDCWARRPWRTRSSRKRSPEREPQRGGPCACSRRRSLADDAAAAALGLSRQHLSSTRSRPPPRPRGRPPRPDGELVAESRALIAALPTYGYRRVRALLRRQAESDGRAAPRPKRLYR